MANVLVVELGDKQRAAPLFVSEGFLVVTSTGSDALRAVETMAPDLVMVEARTVARGAIRLCVALRSATSAPIVTLSEEASEREVIELYSAGVDACIANSVGPYELVARVRAVLRRAPRRDGMESDVIRVGPVVLDGASRELRVNGELVVIPRREFDIAAHLMRKVGVVVTRAELIRELWGSHRDTKSLDVQVGRLRSRLAVVEGFRRIVTVRGVGYRFLADADVPHDRNKLAEIIDLVVPDIDLSAPDVDLVASEAAPRNELSAVELGGS
jgi:DNA-binding response OmpR family regulator